MASTDYHGFTMFSWLQISPQQIVSLFRIIIIISFFFSINNSDRQWLVDDHEKKAATEVWTEKEKKKQTKTNQNETKKFKKKQTWDYEPAVMGTTAFVHILLNCHCDIFKSDKLLYKGTTYKTVKYITF